MLYFANQESFITALILFTFSEKFDVSNYRYEKRFCYPLLPKSVMFKRNGMKIFFRHYFKVFCCCNAKHHKLVLNNETPSDEEISRQLFLVEST